MRERLKALRQRARVAKENFQDTFQAVYPIGSEIDWDRNGRQFGHVVSYTGGERFRVKNRNTGKTYFIRMGDVLR